MTQPETKTAAAIDKLLTAKVAAMSREERFARIQEIADTDVDNEHLDEFAKLVCGPDAVLVKE
jgi:hypothetical protein